MKRFWKDYYDLCKVSGEFYKKHWFGVIAMNAVTIAGIFIWLGRGEIKDQLEERFLKKDEKESQ